MSLMVDLACNEPEIWVALVADGKDELGDVCGYLRLVNRLTQQPGLTTYAVVEARPPHDPPPNPATLKTLFQSKLSGEKSIKTLAKLISGHLGHFFWFFR